MFLPKLRQLLNWPNFYVTCAVPTTSVQLISCLTLTSEEARKIVTGSKDADVGKGALINICNETVEKK